MGQLCSGSFHPAELQMRKSNQLLDYQPQPNEEILQLDTEVDQRGNTTVDHVFKMTRDVYGQRARDLKLKTIDWRDYGIELNKRPSPYDFPAFEHEERLNDNRQKTQDVSTINPASKEKTSGEAPITQTTDAPKTQTVDAITTNRPKNLPKQSKKTTAAKTKNVSKAAAEASKTVGKEAPKETRVSHNREMDRCSLEDEGGGPAA